LQEILSAADKRSQLIERDRIKPRNKQLEPFSWLCHETGSQSQFQGRYHKTGSGSLLHRCCFLQVGFSAVAMRDEHKRFARASRVKAEDVEPALAATFTVCPMNRCFILLIDEKKS